jgi:hypothetical protein
MKELEYADLPADSPERDICMLIYGLASKFDEILPDRLEKGVAIAMLIEARNWAIKSLRKSE